MSTLPTVGLTGPGGGNRPPPNSRTFHPEEDYMDKGTLKELMKKVESLGSKVDELTENDKTKTDQIEQLTVDLATTRKKNKQLEKQLKAILAEKTDLNKKFEDLEKVLKETKVDRNKYKKQCENLVKENESLQKQLKKDGIEEINWWKVAFFGLFVGVVGAVVGGPIIAGLCIGAGPAGMLAGSIIGGAGGIVVGAGATYYIST